MTTELQLADADQSTVLAVLAQLVAPLAEALAPAEVVVHDLSDLDHSVVAISGGLTGRTPGDPATDLLIRMVRTDDPDHQLGYRTVLPGHREARSSTIVVRDPGTHEAVAALCFNLDVSHIRSMRATVDRMLAVTPADLTAIPADEIFPSSVDALLEHSVQRAIDAAEVDVALMKKQHKLTVVRLLNEQGVFQIRDAVDFVAGKLAVTRFTIYNYLNEIHP